MGNKITIKAIISGKVQGVFFRACTQEEAQKHMVSGYVKNLDNGCVEAMFQGSPKRVQAMVDWCSQGSPMSMVNEVTTTSISNQIDYNMFNITY